MRKHDVRLAILIALDRARTPLVLDGLCDSLDIQDAGASRAEIIDALPGLCEHGYVKNYLAGRGGHLYGLEPSGRDQVRRDADMSEYIYGERAFR
jgi:hypothetical protein